MTATAPRLTVDPVTDARYVRFGTGHVARTAEVNDAVMVDLDAEGRVIGVESLIPFAGEAS